MPLAGADGEWSGPLRPSSEWRFHRDIMRARDDIGAIVHTHAPYATALAMLRKPIPAAHYMIAAFGGPTIRCTDYAPFGTQELSDLAVAGLEGRHGVLLGSHGMIATGADLEQAMWRAVELEALAKMYHLALLVGTPAILADEDVAVLAELFKSYGALGESRLRAAEAERRSRRQASAWRSSFTKRRHWAWNSRAPGADAPRLSAGARSKYCPASGRRPYGRRAAAC